MKAEYTEDGDVRHYRVSRSGAPLSWAQFIDALQHDRDGRRWFAQTLASAPFDAFFFETPPVTTATLDDPFEFVLLDSPALARVRQNAAAFAQHFDASAAVTFDNLGGDATLVAPCPGGASDSAHLAAFLRTGAEDAIDGFLKEVGDEVQRRVAARPMWLSSSGLGVYWLHMRLDARPKYYQHAPYRQSVGRETGQA